MDDEMGISRLFDENLTFEKENESMKNESRNETFKPEKAQIGEEAEDEDLYDYDYPLLSTIVTERVTSLRSFSPTIQFDEQASTSLVDTDFEELLKENHRKASVFQSFVQTGLDKGFTVKEMIDDYERHFEEIEEWLKGRKVAEEEMESVLMMFKDSCEEILWLNTGYHLDYREKEELNVETLRKRLLTVKKASTSWFQIDQMEIDYEKAEELFKISLKEQMDVYPEVKEEFLKSLIDFEKSLRKKFEESLRKYDVKNRLRKLFNDCSVELWIHFIVEKTTETAQITDPLTHFTLIQEALQLDCDQDKITSFLKTLQEKFLDGSRYLTISN